MSDLPEGFEVDAGLPEGFVVDSGETPKKASFGEGLKRQALLQLIRTPLDVAAGIPMMAMDAGVQARNFITNPHIPKLNEFNPFANKDPNLPSSMWKQSLDQFLPDAEAPSEKVLKFGQSVALGTQIPSPQAGQQAPAGFVPRQSVQQQTAQQSQNAGYVIPPATTNPTLLNRTLESIGGKEGTAQDAAMRNMNVTDNLVRKTLGLADDAPLTGETLSGIRSQASGAYKGIRGAGEITATPKFTQALDDIEAPFKSASKDFPELANQEVARVVSALRKDRFDSASGVDAIASIREMSQKAYVSGDKSVGKALKSAATALEDVIEENLAGRGKDGADMLSAFKDARQLIAKTYSVEKALNTSTGHVSAQKLGAQLQKGAPLSGDLRAAAQFGQAFPKAAREIVDSGSVRNTDVILGAGTAALSKDPMYLLYPFARQAARAALLSKAGQAGARGQTSGIPPWMLTGPFAASAAE